MLSNDTTSMAITLYTMFKSSCTNITFKLALSRINGYVNVYKFDTNKKNRYFYVDPYKKGPYVVFEYHNGIVSCLTRFYYTVIIGEFLSFNFSHRLSFSS